MEKLQGAVFALPGGTLVPLATVTVFNAGTTVIAVIFSDNVGTPQDNPFTADANAIWWFYAANGRYDVQFSGGGLPSPYVLSDFLLADP